MSRYVRRTKRENSSYLFISVSAGIAVILIVLFCFSVILSKVNASNIVLNIAATVSLCIGGYVGGYICARKGRKNGLIRGAICGIVIFSVVMLSGVLFAKAVLSLSAGGKLILTMLCGGVGGIIGVNTKKRRY